MSEWRKRIAEHPAWDTIRGVREKLAGIEEPDDADLLDELVRMRQVVGALTKLEEIEPEFLSAHMLKQINNVLGNVNNNLDTYLGNPSEQAASLSGANAELEKAFQSGWLLPLGELLGEDGSVLTDEYRRALEGLIDRAREEVAESNERVEQLTTEIQELQAKATELKTEADAKREEGLNALREEVEELQTTIIEQKSRLDSAISQFQEQFSTAQDERRKEFTTLVDQTKTSANEAIDEIRDDATNRLTKVEDEAKSHRDRMADIRSQAEDLLEVITRTGLVAGYQREADEERDAANLWRWIAVAGLVVAMVLAYVFLGQSTEAGRLDVGRYFSRLSIGTVVLALAGYAARQSHSHRRRERYARDVQLELASLGPYLESLPEEIQHEVKVQMAFRMFGRRGVDADEADADISLADSTRRRLSRSSEDGGED